MMYVGVSLIAILPSLSLAAYQELEALTRSSERALTGYAHRFAAEDEKYEGIVALGKSLKAVEDMTKADLPKLTYLSEDYWRAVLEMSPQDSSVLLAHAHIHAARGETAWADAYFLVGSLVGGKGHHDEFDEYRRLRSALNRRTAAEIDKGIQFHDEGEYEKALATYNAVLAAHPNSALAYYEKGLTYMMMSKSNAAMKEAAMQMYGQCRRLAPFYWKAYQGGDPNVIAKLQVYLKEVHPFVSTKRRNKAGFVAFVEGCEAMELYPLAAHGRWKLVLVDSDNAEEHLRRFLELIEKCGCEDAEFFRKQFRLTEGN